MSEGNADKTVSEPPTKKKAVAVLEKDAQEKPKEVHQQQQKEKTSAVQKGKAGDHDADSDSERELVIDLGEDQGGRDKRKPKRETASSAMIKDTASVKSEGGCSSSNLQ